MEEKRKIYYLALKLNSDFFAEAATILYFSGAAIRFALHNTIGKIGLSFLVNTIYVFLFFGTILICIKYSRMRRKSFLLFLAVFIAVALYFWGTLIVHPEYLKYYVKDTVGIWDELFSPVTGCIYGLLVILLCKKADCVWKAIGYSAWIDLAYFSIRVMLASRTGHWVGYDSAGDMVDISYDLGVGYSVMFIAIVFLCKFCEKKKLINLIAAIYSIVLVLNNGSRGALICFGFCIMLLVLCSNEDKKRTLKQKVKIIALLAVVAITLSYFDILIIFSGNLLKNLGFNSRTVDAMLAGTLLSDNGRSTITKYAMLAIKDSGILGLGAFGDRAYIAPYYWWGYSHNIALEMMCDFGIILGPLLLLLLLIVLMKILFSRKSNAYRYSFIVLFSICGKMVVSDTIWGYPHFWALLGMIGIFAYNAKMNNHNYKERKNGG